MDQHASRDIRVLVVGNPANTNALIAASNAKSLDRRQFTAMTRLDHNRALYQIAAKLGIGLPTLRDVVKELMKPGRDVRDDLPAPILRTDVLEIKDLKAGMVLTGTVRNVIDFGVFEDIGVHQDGLVHISQVCNKFIKHPSEIVAVGDIVKVVVLEVDEKKHRISLSMKQVPKDAQ